MKPNVKYKIVSRHNLIEVDGYLLNNRYYHPTATEDVPIGEIENGILTHRNPEGSSPLRVEGLTLISKEGDIFDLVPE